MYVLRCEGNEKSHKHFVSVAGLEESYTNNLLHAKTYLTKEHAIRDACGNEYPVKIEDILHKPQERT